MKVTVTQKELLIMLDVIIFAHIRFSRADFTHILATTEESRRDLPGKIVSNLIDQLSENNDTKEIELMKTDLTNLIGFCNHFEIYKDYEKRGRFKGEDINNIRERLIKLKNDTYSK